MEITDPYTLVMTLKTPDLFFLSTWATSIPALMVSPTAVKANGADWAKTHPIGTGPFKLQTWDFGRKKWFL